jgi:hypothetical protein
MENGRRFGVTEEMARVFKDAYQAFVAVEEQRPPHIGESCPVPDRRTSLRDDGAAIAKVFHLEHPTEQHL